MSLSLAVVFIVIADLALIAGVGRIMWRAKHLTPHRSACHEQTNADVELLDIRAL